MGAFLNQLSYGENMYRNQYEKGTIHAEANALMKLPHLPRKSRLKRVDLLVVRTSREGAMGCSKPCVHCINLMKNKLPEKGYTLHRVYYSDKGGDIVSMTFQKLIDEEGHVSRFYKGRCNHYV